MVTAVPMVWAPSAAAAAQQPQPPANANRAAPLLADATAAPANGTNARRGTVIAGIAAGTAAATAAVAATRRRSGGSNADASRNQHEAGPSRQRQATMGSFRASTLSQEQRQAAPEREAERRARDTTRRREHREQQRLLQRGGQVAAGEQQRGGQRRQQLPQVKAALTPITTAAAQNTVTPHNLGPRSHTCPKCYAQLWPKELNSSGQATLCCLKGKVDLLSNFDTPTPEPLQSLFNGSHRESKHFLQNIRAYNSALSMASIGIQMQEPPGGGGIASVRIKGRVHHRIGSLLPTDPSAPPKFVQLYIIDNETEQATARVNAVGGRGVRPRLMEQLQAAFRRLAEPRKTRRSCAP
jgi:hypothetical protein